MNVALVHLVPFDLGVSFSEVYSKRKYSLKEYLIELEAMSNRMGYTFKRKKHPLLGIVSVSKTIECRLFDFGIGVFVAKETILPFNSEYSFSGVSNEFHNDVVNAFADLPACQIYLIRKLSHISLLSRHKNTQNTCSTEVTDESLKNLEKSAEKYQDSTFQSAHNTMISVMEDIWDIRAHSPISVRPISSTRSYKNDGMSYVLTVYHIQGENAVSQYEHDLDLLMNPEIMSGITDSAQWSNIAGSAKKHNLLGFDRCDIGGSARIAASWSGVALVEEVNCGTLEEVISYEALLQATWFLFDAIIDNIGAKQLNSVDIQHLKNIATTIDLEISTSLSANTSSAIKLMRECIYRTSGIDEIKKRCHLLLDNRIALDRARIESRQSTYGIVMEIMLVAFTLVQIYDPAKNLIAGQASQEGIITLVIMLLFLIACSVFIIRRER